MHGKTHLTTLSIANIRLYVWNSTRKKYPQRKPINISISIVLVGLNASFYGMEIHLRFHYGLNV